MPVAPRIVNDVVSVHMINRDIRFCMAGAVFGEVGG